jgi:ribonuclease P protein component
MPPAAESFDAAEERRIAKAGDPPASRKRPGRLTRSADFERVYRHGRSHANRHLVVYAFPRAEGEEPRVGVSVSRKVGGAVDRNRVKRVLREALAAEHDALPAASDIVVVARPDVRELAEREGPAGVGVTLRELLVAVSGAEAGS